jgi:hypothetical protein
MLLACRFLPIGALATHLSPHVSNTPAPPARGSIWAADVPGWITATGTAILAIGAAFTVIYAVKAFRAQAKELAILVKQYDRDEAERRMAQAAQVFVGADRTAGTLVRPYVKNGSNFPVFNAQSWSYRQGDLAELENLGVILPGRRALCRAAAQPRRRSHVHHSHVPRREQRPLGAAAQRHLQGASPRHGTRRYPRRPRRHGACPTGPAVRCTMPHMPESDLHAESLRHCSSVGVRLQVLDVRVESSPLVPSPDRTVTPGRGFTRVLAVLRAPASGGCRDLAAWIPHAHHHEGWSRAVAGSCSRRVAVLRAPRGCPAGRRRG